MAKQVMDVRAGIGMTLSQSNEHLRVASNGAYVSRLSNNFDPTREHLNFEIKNGKVVPVDKKTSIPRRIENIFWERGIKDPNKEAEKKGKIPNRRTVANFILGGSREQMLHLAFGNQEVDLEHGANNTNVKRMPEIENWAKDMYRFMSEKFGEKNIAAFVVHLDETNPHIHCTILPITKDEKLSWRKIMVGENNSKYEYQQRMTKLHDEISEINAKYGLERGEPIAETGAKHRTTEQYHSDRRKQLKEENEKLGNSIEEKKQTLDSLDKQIKHASARVKALNTMILHLETYKTDLENEIEQLIKDRDAGKISAEEAAKKMEIISQRLEEVKKKILDKEGKLSVAQSQLDELKTKTEATENHFNDVKNKLDKVQPELNKKILHEMQAFGYNIAALDAMNRMAKYNEFKNSLSPEERAFLEKSNSVLLDDSVFEQMADNAATITAVATALFLGYLDKATSISESHGGGSGPTSGWGKKDDEDDFNFKRRCMYTAMHMMHPQSKIKKKR